MKFVIVTGMSGAGKSSVLSMLEDYGYFCVDNMPIRLVPTFMQLVSESKVETQRVALGLDIRSGELKELEPLLEEYEFKILFLLGSLLHCKRIALLSFCYIFPIICTKILFKN